VYHVEVEDTPYLAVGKDKILAVKVRVKPCAGKLVDAAEGKGTNQRIPPAAEKVQLRLDVRVREQGVQAGELFIPVRPPSAQVRNGVVRYRRRGEVGGRGVNARQAARRAPKLGPAPVVVRMPFDEAEQDPLEPRVRRHAAFARPGRDDLRRGDAATAEMVLEVELEQDPVLAGVARAAAQHVPRAAWLLDEHVDVPGAAGQPHLPRVAMARP